MVVRSTNRDLFRINRNYAFLVVFFIGADFLVAVGANVPRENNSVSASHPKEFGPKIPIQT